MPARWSRETMMASPRAIGPAVASTSTRWSARRFRFRRPLPGKDNSWPSRADAIDVLTGSRVLTNKPRAPRPGLFRSLWRRIGTRSHFLFVAPARAGRFPRRGRRRNWSFVAVSASRGNAPAPVGIRPRHRRSPFADGETKKRLLGALRQTSDMMKQGGRSGMAQLTAWRLSQRIERARACCFAGCRRPSWRGAGRRRGACCENRRESEGTPARPRLRSPRLLREATSPGGKPQGRRAVPRRRPGEPRKPGR